MASMTKSDIVNHLSKKLGTTKKLSTQFVDEFVTLAAKEAATGEEIVIPAKKVVKFRVSKSMSDAVFPPKAAPKKKKAAAKKKRR